MRTVHKHGKLVIPTLNGNGGEVTSTLQLQCFTMAAVQSENKLELEKEGTFNLKPFACITLVNRSYVCRQTHRLITVTMLRALIMWTVR